jgi:2-oxoglutarate ferredoxin oxidoreductase subunit beta
VPVTDYLRKRFMPHLWCPGCGNGIVMGCLLRAVEELGLDKNDVVMISGIGCSSRMQGYCDFHTLHTLHGRALAFATGIKLGRPELTILVPMGDGDALAIGGNHFIHAARRNIDMTAIVLNNGTYGMTGGQHSPLTACGEFSSTAPFGTVDRQFDAVALARGAGATYVARSTTYHARQMTKLFVDAISHKGFSVVEVLTQCPTYYGRRNAKGDAVTMMEGYRDGTVNVGERQPGDERTEIGVFVDESLPEYCEAYAGVVELARKRGGVP